MLLAVLNGSLGFLCAMGVPFFGAVGIAKALGESIPLSYGAIAALCVGCGVLRGGLRYLEQYGGLTQTTVTEGGYRWLNDPWPWDEGGSD